ncbi:DUF1223 domain-containing protein [Lichenifustis flavocetrariae]|uniref:DUF1223 domain-containing protein n=1 Tax=Lichenifustis flavocetrariae TaxID=2949735 RepID=A0AA41Z443_9HYPH|nr:DUF1223 domain-containing protein [Lichenifustis flavocetrariae]MCW6512583.1 DUF1223 domain-containing protein [Lichenifustis flavocetrariae]
MRSRLLAFSAMLGLLPAVASAAERPVVVELFTSEGCSSCPPADAYLTELSHAGRNVLPLAFHVTYWNGLGWKDPFSLDAATQRQARYGSRFGDGSYTPEMVVDGVRGFVGSERGEVGSAIQKAREDRTVASVTVSREGGRVSVQVGPGSGTGRLLLIGFDPEHQTAVGRGENSGRTLTESNIVRSVRTIGQWSGASLQVSEPMPAGQDVAVLLEAPDGRIVGASRLGGDS